jgi:hypothetical protein
MRTQKKALFIEKKLLAGIKYFDMICTKLSHCTVYWFLC